MGTVELVEAATHSDLPPTSRPREEAQKPLEEAWGGWGAAERRTSPSEAGGTRSAGAAVQGPKRAEDTDHTSVDPGTRRPEEAALLLLPPLTLLHSEAIRKRRPWGRTLRDGSEQSLSFALTDKRLMHLVCVCVCVCVLVAQSCPTLGVGPPMDCSPPGSSVHGILQARILERVAIFFSRGSSRPRDRT